MEVGGFGEGDFDGDAAADGGADESVALEHGNFKFGLIIIVLFKTETTVQKVIVIKMF